MPARSETRVALVVGNSAYRHIPALDNPANDARLMATTLRSLGFSLVDDGPQLDVDKARLDALVQAFGELAQGADVALFYYAGHGMQVRGANYLVPVGANPTKEADVDFQMLDAGLVLRQMESAGTRLNFVILDACRNNPFGGRGLRSTGTGLAQMRAPEGTLISYATQPGNVALDGRDGNSPYTRSLAQTISRPGLDVFQTFNEVGLAVMQATGNTQQPWLASSPLRGSFYFAGAGAGTGTGTAARPDLPPTPRPADIVPPPQPQPVQIPVPRRMFRVLESVSEGILNMRTGPGAGNPVVVAIPAGTADLAVGRCRRAEDGSTTPWCEVQWRGSAGWVSGRYIAEVTERPRPTFRVLADVSQGVLNMRAGPGVRFALIGSIPAGAADVAVGRCRLPDDGGRTPWCEVEWRGRTGWASACCMVNVDTGAYARAGE
ncbi:MAG: caspase family protein [Rhodoplanes sp.]|uniref:caspase family protein n=1 Tax=Rhodoplanes sp. TaxID=1968906 RepID=UPI0017F557AC|nr:caspase family protein [Rhodoplanes sp.]NVO14658.1 caspase family protein [Rhodoplanes sp.]